VNHLRPALVLLLLAGCAGARPAARASEPAAQAAAPVAAPSAPAPAPLAFPPMYFTYDHADLTPAVHDQVKAAVEALLAAPDVKVDVEGHCDERGTDDYNIDLGWKRAYAVRDALVRQGLAEDRLYPTSYGRARPAVVGSDESAWSLNRRVQLATRK